MKMCMANSTSPAKRYSIVCTAFCDTQGVIVAVENQAQQYYGLQYHPEVKHTDRGMETLKHFLFGIAKLSADWKLENILEEELEKLRRQVSIGHQASWMACVTNNFFAASRFNIDNITVTCILLKPTVNAGHQHTLKASQYLSDSARAHHIFPS